MKPFAAAARMASGRTFMVFTIGINASRHIRSVSTASKIASLSSCISLL